MFTTMYYYGSSKTLKCTRKKIKKPVSLCFTFMKRKQKFELPQDPSWFLLQLPKDKLHETCWHVCSQEWDVSVMHEQLTLSSMTIPFGTKYTLAETILTVLKSKHMQLLLSTIAYLENCCSEVLKSNGVSDKMDQSTPPAFEFHTDETFTHRSPLVIGNTCPI